MSSTDYLIKGLVIVVIAVVLYFIGTHLASAMNSLLGTIGVVVTWVIIIIVIIILVKELFGW
ncbi:MAG: hypothetical protein HY831_02595 [Candidatus Aenigmarchaeota archaeon]|nr:hypothetical protein [Candidatus Aenigmarchaeota archaeon]